MPKTCNAHKNPVIPCEGYYVPSEGLCFRHAYLFDIWICEHGGHRVYAYKGVPSQVRNSPSLRAWKRSKFHDWLCTLTVAQVERMLGGRLPKEDR